MNADFLRAQTLTPPMESIDVLTRVQYQMRRMELFRRGLPFVVRKYFVPVGDASVFDELNRAFGSELLSARRPGDARQYASDRNVVELRFDEYLRLLKDSTSNGLPYAANNRIPPHVFRMLGIEHPFEHLNRNVRDPNIWIGPSGASTPLHKDSTDNAALQLFGSKRWTLYSIADHDLLRFEASSYGSYVHRNAEFAVSARNDDAAVNSTANASEPIPHDVVVDAGDLLYVPYGWGHSVENITVSVMLNVWFALDNYRPLVVCL